MKALQGLALSASLGVTLGVVACGGGGDGGGSEIRIDGSSTVAPLSEPIGALFSEENEGVSTTVGTAGTGGGFERFCAGETDISDASRPIEPDEEALCEENGVEFEEIVVANDALSVVVNPDNPVTCMSPDQLSEVYGEDATITSWSDISDLDAPYDEELEIFSPGADSGTFDYFTDAINGEEGVQRSEGVNVVGEDDNATVTGVAGSPGGIGYFGFSFFTENQDTLKALEIENEDGDCVAPSAETAQDGSYNPLARELYIYPSAAALERPEVQEFVQFYLENVTDITEEAGFIPLTEEQLAESQSNLDSLLQGGGSSTESGGTSTEGQ